MTHRIVLLWQRFGPYHAARLNGLREVASARGWEAIGIQVASSDEYAWNTKLEPLPLVTLFPNTRYQDISRSQLIQVLEKNLEECRPSCICVNGWSVTEAVFAKKWASRRKIPVILMSETHRPSGSVVKELVKRWRVRGCAGAIVGGNWQRDYLVRLGMNPERVRFGYDVVDNDHFGRQQNTTELPFQELGLQPGKYFFVNTRFLARKGVAQLLTAYQLYHRRCLESKSSTWPLVISGSGEEEESWKRLAKDLMIDSQVHWLGFLQYHDLPAWYQNAGVFVHPALSEAWGLVINEACAAGLPVIVGREVGASCELVNHGENGWVVDPQDSLGVANALSEASQMSSLDLLRMGEASKKRVHALSPHRFGESICDLIASGR